MSQRLRFGLLWLCAFAACVPAKTVSTPPALGPAAVTPRQALLATLRGITRQQYPNADEVLVEQQIQVRYRPDGTSEKRDEQYTKVLTERGLSSNQAITFSFDEIYETDHVERLELLKPDGRVVQIALTAETQRMMTDPTMAAMNVYGPNYKILVVNVPGLEVNDTIHLVYREDLRKARIPRSWADRQLLESLSPFRRLVYEVIAPATLPLQRIALRHEVPGTVRFSKSAGADGIHYRWEASNVSQMYPEPAMPSLSDVVQRLVVSTVPDWQTISRWYWKLSAPHLQVTAAMKQTVAALTSGKDRQQQIDALFTYVSQHIRYLGLIAEKDAPGYEPHDAALTFAKKHGVCRDKAALLVAMLREAGFAAYPVLIHTGPKKDPTVPDMNFSHAIVAVEEAKGSYTLMDATDESTKQLFPAALSDKSYLVAKPEGEALRTSPIVPAEKNLVRVATEGQLDAAGDFVARSVLTFEGVNDSAFRGYFAGVKPDERRQYFEGIAKRLTPGAQLTDFRLEPSEIQDTSKPLVATVAFRAPSMLVSDGKTTVLPLPWWGTEIGLVQRIFGQLGLEQRKYPLRTGVACGVEERLQLKLDKSIGPTISMPTSTPIAQPLLAWEQQLGRQGQVLQAQQRLLLKAVELSPREYLRLKASLKDIEYNLRKMPIFAQQGVLRPATAKRTIASPPGAPSQENDIVFLKEEMTCEVTDQHSWTEIEETTLKVLTYAGKKQYAELKFSFNPAWEELTLEEATTTDTQGQTKAIERQETNLMDAPWVAAAPRYPAEKQLVASLPGIDVGSVIHYRLKRRKWDRPLFSFFEYMQYNNRIESKQVTLKAPPALSVKYQKVLPGAKPLLQELKAGSQPLQWKVTGQAPIRSEENLPPPWTFVPLLMSGAGTWADYAQDLRSRLEQAAANQTAARSEALHLVRDKREARAKIIALRDYVARTIRPAGPAFNELPLRTLTPADRTLRDGYGHSADRAILLAALLRAAGFSSSFVLASNIKQAQGLEPSFLSLPTDWAFDQVLVRTVLDGEPIYLNDTNQYAALGATAYDGYWGLDLDAGKLIEIAAPKPLRDQDVTTVRIKLDAKGHAEISREDFFYGSSFGGGNEYYTQLLPEARRRHYQQLVSALSLSARARGDLTTHFDSYPGRQSFSVTVDRFAVRDGKYLYLSYPFTGLLPGVSADTRKHPLYWESATRQAYRVVIELPAACQRVVLAPQPLALSIKNQLGTIRLDRTETPGPQQTLVIERQVTLPPAVIPAAQYAELLAINQQLGHRRNMTVLLEMGD